MKANLFGRGFLPMLLAIGVPTWALPQSSRPATPPDALQKRAWDMLAAGARDSRTEKRADAVQALGLITADAAAAQLAEAALEDKQEAVRAAAAQALGVMGSTASVPKLEAALADKSIKVALAAGRSLLQLKNVAGYDVYYAVLTGARKSGQGLIEEQMNELRNPHSMAALAFDQGIGFAPFGGYALEAMRAIKSHSSAPTRAAAARALAHDPDVRSGQALLKATSDNNWLVRAAAVQAIGRRGDPSLRKDVEPAMADKKDQVRYLAAAAVVHLSRIAAQAAGQ